MNNPDISNNPLISVIFCISLIICISISQYVNPLILFILMAYAIYQHRLPDIIKAIARIRWILIFVVLITSFSTPGELIQPFLTIDVWPVNLTPTYEGCILGAMQSVRLICLISVISLLTSSIKRDDLISAFYHLLAPFSLLGFSAERFAARLCLTLEYMQRPLSFSESMAKLSALKQQPQITQDSKVPEMIHLALIELDSLGFMMVFCIALLPFIVEYFQI